MYDGVELHKEGLEMRIRFVALKIQTQPRATPSAALTAATGSPIVTAS